MAPDSFGFIRVRPGGRLVHMGWLGSFGRALGVIWARRGCHFGASLLSLGRALRVVGFVGFIRGSRRVSLGSFGRAQGGVVFIKARPGGSLGSFWRALVVVGFIRFG